LSLSLHGDGIGTRILEDMKYGKRIGRGFFGLVRTTQEMIGKNGQFIWYCVL